MPSQRCLCGICRIIIMQCFSTCASAGGTISIYSSCSYSNTWIISMCSAFDESKSVLLTISPFSFPFSDYRSLSFSLKTVSYARMIPDSYQEFVCYYISLLISSFHLRGSKILDRSEDLTEMSSLTASVFNRDYEDPVC